MGYVRTFCQISGCCPTSASDLASEYHWDDLYEDGEDVKVKKRWLRVLASIEKKEEPRLEVTVVGPIERLGESFYGEETEFLDQTAPIVAQHSSSLRLVPHCVAGEYYEFGSVSSLHPLPLLNDSNLVPEARDYLISYGPCFFVMSSTLPILLLATQGRVTPQGLWLLEMQQGRNDNKAGYVLADVNYGEVTESIDQFLSPLSGLGGALEEAEQKKVVEKWVNEAQTNEELVQTVVHEGGYWVWMSPDDFPLQPTSPPPSPPSFADSSPSTSSSSSSCPDSAFSPPAASLTSLPLDLLLLIASYLPLPSLLALTALCRPLRRTLLCSSSSRSRLARAWLSTGGGEGSCWLPVEPNVRLESASGVVEEGEVRLRAGGEKVRELEERDDWWSYLRRCKSSGSMRNRRRIWAVARRIEEVCERVGV